MARPTERALKRQPKAVILLTVHRDKVPNVTPNGMEFEWFEDDVAMKEFFDQNVAFHQEDTKEHEDMAYLAVEITDTQSSPMKVGRVDVQPATEAAEKWHDDVKADITKAFYVEPKKTDDSKAGGRVVRARKKSTAAKKAAVSTTKKSETGDKKPPAKKAAAKKTAAKPAAKAEEKAAS